MVAGTAMRTRRRHSAAPSIGAGVNAAWVAAAGIVVNGGTALLFLRGQADMNVGGACLHLMADAAGLAGMVHDGPDGEALVRRAIELVRAQGIGHATLQVEAPALAEACALRPDAVV